MLGLGFLLPQKKKTSDYQKPEAVLDSLKDSVLVLDKHHKIQHFNNSWSNIIKRKDRDIRYSHFAHNVHPEDLGKWHAAVASLSLASPSERITLRILSSTQELKWLEVHLQLINPSQAYPITLTLSDVTYKKQQLEIHKAGHRNLSGLVSRMPAILYRGMNNTKWTMEYISDGCFELTGYTPEQLLNQTQFSFGDLIHPDDAQEVWETVQIAIQDQSCFMLTYRLRNKNGVYKKVIEKGQALYSPSGEVLGIEGIIMNL